MIVLDTNVLSELMRSRPDASVVTWMDQVSPETVWTTAISVFEIRFGLELLESGSRRQALETAFDAMIHSDLNRRVLPFDDQSAQLTAEISASGRKAGQTVDLRDSMIAGIVAAQDASLVTRNVRHFENAGIDLINPWEVGDRCACLPNSSAAMSSGWP